MNIFIDDFIETLPVGWKYDRFKDVAMLRNEKTNTATEEKDYLELEDIESGTGKVLSWQNTLEVESAVTLFQKGDILFGKLRPYLEKYYEAEIDGKCTGEILAFKPERIYGRFLFYCLGSRFFVQRCNALAYGAKMPRVNWTTQLAQFNFPLPPLPEQERIAAYLDKSCAAIDAAMQAKQSQIETLEKLRAATIQKAITKGLADSVELVETGSQVITQIPKGWKLDRLKDVSEIRYGLGQPPAELKGGVPMIRATNVDSGKITERDLLCVDPDELPLDREPYLKAGEIIVVRSGAYTGDSSIVPPEYEGAVAGYDMVVRVTHADPKFIAYGLLSPHILHGQIKLLTLRAAQPHLNAQELGGIIFAIPPTREEQRSIAHYLDKRLAEIGNVKAVITKQTDTLLEYRKSLIHECVTGQRRVTEADLKQV